MKVSIIKGFYTFLILSLLIACKKDETGIPGNAGDWKVPIGDIKDGGPGKDGIPALENPVFVDPSEVDYLDKQDLVIGFKTGDEVRVYPHKILDWHEIINDLVGEMHPVAITYCPLTGSGIAWNRNINGKVTTFGVSGLIYNSNLIPYDRSTGSNWSQMRLDCVNGELLGEEIKTYPLVETTWETMIDMYPNAKVVSDETGWPRNYNLYPYGDYKTNHHSLIFTVRPEDTRLRRKERVLGVIVDGNAKVYRFSSFDSQVAAINDTFKGTPIVITGSSSKNLMVAYQRKLSDGTILEFTPVQDNRSIILEDNEGNQWNAFGEAENGPRKGEKLIAIRSYIGYWFAWGAFYPDAEIYEL